MSDLLHHLLVISGYHILRLVPARGALSAFKVSAIPSVLFSAQTLCLFTNIFAFLFFRSFLQLQFNLYPDAIVDYAASWGAILLINYSQAGQSLGQSIEFFSLICICTVTYGLSKRKTVDNKGLAVYAAVVASLHTLIVWKGAVLSLTDYLWGSILTMIYLLKDSKDKTRLLKLISITSMSWLLVNTLFKRDVPMVIIRSVYTNVMGMRGIVFMSIIENILAINRKTLNSLCSFLWEEDATLLLKSDILQTTNFYQSITSSFFSKLPTPQSKAAVTKSNVVSFSFVPKFIKNASAAASSAATSTAPTSILGKLFSIGEILVGLVPQFVCVSLIILAVYILIQYLRSPPSTAKPSTETPPKPSNSLTKYSEHAVIWVVFVLLHVPQAVALVNDMHTEGAKEAHSTLQIRFFICLVLVQWIANAFVLPAVSSSTAKASSALSVTSRPLKTHKLSAFYSKHPFQALIPKNSPYYTVLNFVLHLWLVVNVGACVHRIVKKV